MKYTVHMGSDVMRCIPSFVEIGSTIHMLIGRTYRQTDRKEIA
jgi:hypothetical protein